MRGSEATSGCRVRYLFVREIVADGRSEVFFGRVLPSLPRLRQESRKA